MQFNKLYLSISLLLIGAIWVACVDIPSGPGTNVNPNFRSTVRFFHAAQSRAANSITIDGAAAGPSMSYLGNSGYLDVASGSRSLSFGGSTAVTQAFGSEQQSTLVVYEVPAAGGGTDVAYLNLVEGHYKTNNGVAGFAKVKFVNAANGAAATVAFRKNAATPASNTIATAAFGAAPQYLQLDPDTAGGAGISVFGISSGGYQTSDIKGANEVPPVTSGSTGSGTVDFLTGDSLIMNATVKSMNSEGFYTSAHIHNGAAGVAGPVLYPLLADSQQTMTFRTTTINGAQEVPPVTTTATGTGTLTLRGDSSARGGAAYSVTTTTPTSTGFFTAAHFHNGDPGVIGPVVNPFDVTKQTISFPTTNASGAQEVPPVTGLTARARATFTLYRDSLVYFIDVFRDAVDTPFTAMHFHAGPAGLIGLVRRDLRTTPWSNDSLNVKGTWKRTDAQPLTTGLVDSIRQGLVYLNVHSTGRPGGIMRAQLVPNATHTNTFSGRFTGTSFFNLKDQFAYSRMYFNFHTTANPGGEIRGQATPDTFTTNAYTRTVTGVPDSIGALLNAGRVYFNFHTSANPGGAVRGQLGVDATKGEYAKTSLTVTGLAAGRMYTVLAVGRGATFQLLMLEDRRFGATKPIGIPMPNPIRKTIDQGRNE